MRTIYLLVFSIFLIAYLSSCGSIAPRNPRHIHSPAIYSPNYFKNKGEMKLSLGGGFFWEEYTTQTSVGEGPYKDVIEREIAAAIAPQVAYAFHDHFFVSLGASFYKEKDNYKDNDVTGSKSTPSQIKYNRKSLDVAIGAFTPFTESRKSYISATVGANVGNFHSSLSQTNNPQVGQSFYFDSNAYKYYLTPAFDYHFSPYFRMSLALRIALLSYGNIRTNYSESNLSNVGLNMLEANTFTVYEPSLNFQIGMRKIDWLKFDIGLQGSSNPKSSNYEYDNLRSRKPLLTLGISIYPNINRRNHSR